MSSTAITTKGPGDLWHEPDPEPGFYDWWETINDETAIEWADEFIETKGGPLCAIFDWGESMTMGSVYVTRQDIEKMKIPPALLAKSYEGELLTAVVDNTKYWRVDIEDIYPLIGRQAYGLVYLDGKFELSDLLNLLAYCIRSSVRKRAIEVSQKEKCMRDVWEAL